MLYIYNDKIISLPRPLRCTLSYDRIMQCESIILNYSTGLTISGYSQDFKEPKFKGKIVCLDNGGKLGELWRV